MQTTLNKIRSYGSRNNLWEKLLRTLGKTKADDEPLSIIQILDSNGLDDALWCLRTVEGYDREIRLFALRCASRVPILMSDSINVRDQYSTERLSAIAYAFQRALEAATSEPSALAVHKVTRLAAWSAGQAATWAERDVQEKELREICALPEHKNA